MDIQTVNLSEKFAQFSEHWTPKLVGALNGQHVKLAKFKGEFVMHQHEGEDELFFVVKGHLRIELEDQVLKLGPGEFAIIPRGTLHKPVAIEEVEVLLFEPASTLNTGNAESALTVRELDHL